MIKNKGITHNRKVLLVIKLVLVLVLGHVVIKTAVMPRDVRESLAPSSAGGSEVQPVAAADPVSDLPAPDYSAIFARDLFGSRVGTPVVGEPEPAADAGKFVAPSEDDLDIALIGTVAGSPAFSRAIIKDLDTNVLGLYKTGDRVLTASIEKIERNRVILRHRGRLKVLSQHNPDVRPADPGKAQPTLQASAPGPGPAAPAPMPKAVATSTAGRLRQTAMMLTKATVEPHAVEGEVDGLKVSDLDGIEGADSLGLKDGDVIRAINGHRLNSKQKAFQIAMKARSQPTLNVELMRDSKIETFSLPLR